MHISSRPVSTCDHVIHIQLEIVCRYKGTTIIMNTEVAKHNYVINKSNDEIFIFDIIRRL